MGVDRLLPGLSSAGMFLKRRVRRKDGKDHIYYSVCESLRVRSGRVIQRQVLHLGEPRPLRGAEIDCRLAARRASPPRGGG